MPQERLPSDCFQLEDLEVLKSFDGKVLSEVWYYIWQHPQPGGGADFQFLFCVELLFDAAETLLLTSGEQSTAIQVTNTAALVKIAHELQQINGKPVLTRMAAGSASLWHSVGGKTLEAIRLARHPDSAYYANDALMFDFGSQSILLKLGEKEGMIVISG